MKHLLYLLCFVPLVGSPSRADVPYRVTEIPVPAGVVVASPGASGVDNFPAVNALHQVAVTFETDTGAFRPYIYGGGNLTALPLPADAVGAATAGINDLGQVVGFALNSHGAAYPVTWQAAGGVTVLDRSSQAQGAAWSVNASGQISGVVGNYFGEPGLFGGAGATSTAATWNAGVLSPAGNASPDQASASAINSAGQVLVTSFSRVTGNTSVSIDDHGKVLALGDFRGYHLKGRDLNDRGQIVGTGSNDAGDSIAYLWDNGVFSTLGPFAEDVTAIPWAINAAGTVVGQSIGAGGARAVLWQNGQAVDLNTLISPNTGWQLTSATDIADDGTVVGTGIFNGQLESFTLTPSSSGGLSLAVPEPATLILFLAGTALLLKKRRK